MKIAITGANSSVGINLASHAADLADASVVALVRSETAAESLPILPRLQPRIAAYDQPGAIADALRGVDVVVHLAGILIETRWAKYQQANIDTTAAVVKAAQQEGISHLVLVSVLGADPHSANPYLASKGEAESIVSQSTLSTSILRTPILLGKNTAGGDALLAAAKQDQPKLLGGGTYTMRPLDVDDLSRAILCCCEPPSSGTTVHELAGPESVQYRELVSRTAALMGRSVEPAAVPIWLARMGAGLLSRLQRGGISPAVIDVITADEIVHNNADSALGITLTPLQDTLQRILSKEQASQ